MPVTTLHKLIGLSVAMLGQAPGTDLLQQWTRLYTQSREDGLNAMAALQKVAQHILDSAAFEEVHPPYTIIENEDFAQRFLNQLLGETASAEVVTLVVGLLDGGTSRAEVAVRAVEYLLEVSHQGSDHADYATFGTYAMRFGNQVEVARYYTVDKKWMTPGESVLNEVDDTAASVTAAKSDIDGMQQPGKNFTLTTGVDQFTGTPGNDTFVATESTLNGADRLHGKEGMDTLELSSGSGANDDISIPLGATVKGIETLSVNSDGKFSGDVSKWEGLKTVQLEVVENVDLELKAGDGTKVTSTSLGDDDDASTVTIENAGMVALEGVSKQATVKITGEGTESVMVEGGKSVHVNTKASPSTTVNSVTVDGVARNNGDDGKRDGTTGAGTAAKDKDKASVEVYSKALENIALHNTDAIVLLQNDDKDMTELTAMVNKFGLSASMMGKLCLKGIEDLMLQVAGASYFDLASNEIKMIDVSGAGDLTLDVNKFDNSTASTTLESLMLSGLGKFTMKDASGLSKLKTIDASDATGDVSITKLGNGVTSYTGSSGKDTISVAAFAKAGLMANLGAGDDTFTVDNAGAGTKSKIDGGAGMDTLVLEQKVGANLKGAGDAYSNFESITLEAGGGSGKYDLEGLAIDKLMISKTTGSGGVTFDNVTPGMGLSASSPAGGRNVAVVNYMVGQVPRFSNSSTTLNLQMHAVGHKDDTTDSGGGTNYIGGGYARLIKTGSNRGVDMTLTVDDGVEQLIIDTSTKLNGSKLKAADYVHRVRLKGGKSDGTSEIEYIKVVGDASIYLSATTSKASGDLSNLKLVDLTEVTGIARFQSNSASDVKIMGGDGGNVIGVSRSGTGNHELIGGKLPDVIPAGTGNDKITGGGGGDLLGGFSGTNTYIYNAAEDSQVRFDSSGDPASGFDTIAALATGSQANPNRHSSFTGAYSTNDKIDLRKVVDLQGDIQRTKGSQDGVANNGNPYQGKLSKYLENYGDGLFETDLASEFGKKKHTIFVVETAEVDKSINGAVALSLTVPDNPNAQDAGIGAGNGNDKVTWILVDVDGDGDFDASTDMAIATLGWFGGAITRDDFVT